MLLFGPSKPPILLSFLYTAIIVAAVLQQPSPLISASLNHAQYRRIPAFPANFVQPGIGASAYYLSPDWVLDFHAFHTLLPFSTAATALLSFYEEIAAFAATSTSRTAERYLLRVGEITLEVRSGLGALPWADLVAFANWMRENTKRGFTGTYQLNFVHRPTGNMLTMSLWVGVLRWG